jgi:hypothetical protein
LRDAGWFQLSADALDGQSHADSIADGLVDKLQRGDFSDTDLATAIPPLRSRRRSSSSPTRGAWH